MAGESTLDALNAADDSDVPDDDKTESEETPEETAEEETPEPEAEEEPEEGQEEEEEEKSEGEVEETEELAPEDDEFVRASAIAKDLSTKHKGIFKEFPQLRGILFRDEQYRAIFPSIESAEEADKRSAVLSYMEETIGNGDPEPLIRTLGESELATFAKKFVPLIAARNPKAAHAAFLPVVNGVLRQALKDAQRLQNANLGKASQIISNYINGTNTPPEEASAEEDPEVKREKEKLENEKRGLAQQRFTDFRDKVVKKGDASLYNVVRQAFDKDKTLSDFVKDALTERTWKQLMGTLEKDEAHIRVIDSLWLQARRAGFTEEWASRIVNAMLGSARPIIPRLAAKVRAESLQSKKPVKKAGIVVNPGPPGRVTKLAAVPKKEINFRETSTLDIIQGNITPKRK